MENVEEAELAVDFKGPHVQSVLMKQELDKYDLSRSAVRLCLCVTVIWCVCVRVSHPADAVFQAILSVAAVSPRKGRPQQKGASVSPDKVRTTHHPSA